MRLRSIRYFLTLAETKPYTKAAEKLGVSQPSISHAIRPLEKELGLPLFHPERRTELTEWGEQFVAAARSALSILDEGSAWLHESEKAAGYVTFTADENMREADRSATVEFTVTDGSERITAQAVVTQKYGSGYNLMLDVVFNNDGTAYDASPSRRTIEMAGPPNVSDQYLRRNALFMLS